VSLNGSLDGFALPDVLVLLSSTRKSGELRVWGDRTEGSVWLAEGQVVAAASAESQVAVEAISDLLRLRGGNFSFEIGQPPDTGEARSMESLLLDAQTVLDEWRTIESVVPSLDAPLELVRELPVEHVTVGANQWKALLHLAAAPGTSAQALRAPLGLSELGAARAAKELIEAGLATVRTVPVESVAPVSAVPAADAAPRQAVGRDVDDVWEMARRKRTAPEPEAAPATRGPVPVRIPAPPPVDATPGDVATEATGATGDQPINRDVLLKFISTTSRS
jgi:hypothetical protein